MAFAEVGAGSQSTNSGANDGVDSDALAFPANVTSGSLLICAGAVWGSTAAPTAISVSGSLSGAFTVVLGSVPGGTTWRTFIAYVLAPSTGAETVTVNPSGADSVHSFSFSIDEYSGPHATPASVNDGTAEGSSGTASNAVTTAVDDELIIGVMSHDGATGALTVTGTSFVQIDEVEANSANQCHNACFRIVTTITSYTASWTNTNTTWGAQVHTFKPAVAGGAAPARVVPSRRLALLGAG